MAVGAAAGSSHIPAMDAVVTASAEEDATVLRNRGRVAGQLIELVEAPLE
jgi:hypothetical protein